MCFRYITRVAGTPIEWTVKSAWMRAQGAVSAEWDESDRVTAITLGTAPLAPRDPADKPAAPKPVNRTDEILRGGSTLKPRARE